MAFLGLKALHCTLCGRSFTLVSGDLVLPEYVICDLCLQELWPLQGDALVERVSRRLQNDSPGRQRRDQQAHSRLLERIVKHLDAIREGGTLEELLQRRETDRHM